MLDQAAAAPARTVTTAAGLMSHHVGLVTNFEILWRWSCVALQGWEVGGAGTLDGASPVLRQHTRLPT
jgi:hypothetical protein